MNKVIERMENVTRFLIGSGTEFMNTNFKGKEVKDKGSDISLVETTGGMEIRIPLKEEDHILGLGEKALPVERKRTRSIMWNYDSYNYELGTDPMYASIPFFMKIRDGKPEGFLINYTGKIVFDFGVEDYTHILITVNSKDFAFYVMEGDEPDQILRIYSEITGFPFHLPQWSLEHQISKYSYYPQERVEEVVNKYITTFGTNSVGAVYLDIDYMEDYKIFTHDKGKFPDMRGMINNFHARNVRVIPILDPGIKLDQNNEIFKKGIGKYVETPTGEIFTGDVWPGKCVFPDFFNSEGRDFWSESVSEFMKEGYDGIWLDMNDPSVHHVDSRTIAENSIHHRDGVKVRHSDVHNAYCLEEAKATFESLREGDKFILSRSGYAGIQKYAAIWSGDGLSTFENMWLQIPLLTSLSISGIPYVGCDLGGFSGYSSPELILRFYQMGLFFPIYRNHKVKEGNDQELYVFDLYYKGRFKQILDLRHNLVSYLKWKAEEAAMYGKPIIRPLAYNFPREDGIFTIDDEYMVGMEFLLAPIVTRSSNRRELYLPDGIWYEFNSTNIYSGKKRVSSEGDLPLFLRNNSVVIIGRKLLFFGDVEEEIYLDGEWHLFKSQKGKATLDGKNLKSGEFIDVEKEKPTLSTLQF
ncbi:MAG: TIM-barrel domain-containing protein [Cuniculiplasma sp.]